MQVTRAVGFGASDIELTHLAQGICARRRQGKSEALIAAELEGSLAALSDADRTEVYRRANATCPVAAMFVAQIAPSRSSGNMFVAQLAPSAPAVPAAPVVPPTMTSHEDELRKFAQAVCERRASGLPEAVIRGAMSTAIEHFSQADQALIYRMADALCPPMIPPPATPTPPGPQVHPVPQPTPPPGPPVPPVCPAGMSAEMTPSGFVCIPIPPPPGVQPPFAPPPPVYVEQPSGLKRAMPYLIGGGILIAAVAGIAMLRRKRRR